MVPTVTTMTDEKQNPDTDHRGVESLTEVLRLQAEALSRISERMSGMRGMSSGPTPIPPPAESKAESGSGSTLPALAGDPALNEESLPVLNSFKKFLDHERRRARKRILWVLFGFTVAFSGVLAVIVWMNRESVCQLNTDITQANARVERSRQETEAEIKRMQEKTALSATQSATSIRKDITRNILWAHSVISSNLNTEIAGRDETLDRLKEKISALEIENTMLTRQVNELARRMKAVEADCQDYLERPLLESQIRDQDAAAAATNVPVSPDRVAPLTINSVRFGRSMQLQVPRE